MKTLLIAVGFVMAMMTALILAFSWMDREYTVGNLIYEQRARIFIQDKKIAEAEVKLHDALMPACFKGRK